MAKIESVLRNFANHATSGLSSFILLAYEACERSTVSSVTITLKPSLSLTESVLTDNALKEGLEVLLAKFTDILRRESGMPFTDVESVVISLNFDLQSAHVQAKQEQLKALGVSYAHDPIYTGQIVIQLKSGREYCSPIQSHDA